MLGLTALVLLQSTVLWKMPLPQKFHGPRSGSGSMQDLWHYVKTAQQKPSPAIGSPRRSMMYLALYHAMKMIVSMTQNSCLPSPHCQKIRSEEHTSELQSRGHLV